MPTGFYIALLFLAGALLPFQAGMNAELAKYTSHGQALFLSFFVGLPLVVAALALPPAGLPTIENIKIVPAWVWLGGVIGIIYVTTVIFSAKHTGAFALVGAVTAGQIIGSIAADHYGMAGFTKTSLSWQRIAGALFVATGVWLSMMRTDSQ